ncbi:hypothetical protein FQN54_002774 [Arachnomyces sp. PD_36]|nr:hypothetical protein FQN54_002774 [Arachnomyces sp. PD_36]
MFRNTIALALAALSIPVIAKQPLSAAPIEAPIRNLTWGQLNFLHTTDTHGWLAGHLLEPSFSADWGDYVSFATRMRELAEESDIDLLVVDTGDRVDGSGLYDTSDPKGKYITELFKEQQIDVICSGNHELYKQATSEREFLTMVPNFEGRYLSSNIDIFDPRTGDQVPLAQRYKKFTTEKQGIRIVAFGFLFDFTGNYNNTVVQPVAETVQESWFQEAIDDTEVDLFLFIGHVPVDSHEYQTIFRAVRQVHPDIPIQFFGGHFHIRDYVKYDSKSYGLASGRYMETIGFMSIDGLSTNDTRPDSASTTTPTFSRSYIDNNLFSFQYHTGLDESSFQTEHGETVSKMIEAARESLELNNVYGCAPKSLWVSRAEYPGDDSIYSWITEQVLVDAFSGQSGENKYGLAVLNTGGIRFDIFKGPFTKDTMYTISPFDNAFRYVKDVPYQKATEMIEVLNEQEKILAVGLSTSHLKSSQFLGPPERMAAHHDAGYDDYGTDSLQQGEGHSDQVPLSHLDSPNLPLTPGYITRDDAGDDGDDTEHTPIKHYQSPNCFHGLIPPPGADNLDDSTPETVDFIYVDFIEPWLDVAAQIVGLDLEVKRDSREFMPGTTISSVILDWVTENWKCDEKVRTEL